MRNVMQKFESKYVWAPLCLLLFAGLLVGATIQYFPTANLTIGDILYANTSSSMANLAAVASGSVLTSQGTGTAPAWSTNEKTDGTVFLPATEFCKDYTASTAAVVTRAAANDRSLSRTAAGAETHIFICSLDSWLQRTTASKGVKINTLGIVHQITVVANTSSTWGKVAAVTYANNVANSVGADLATAPTLPTATQANPYVTAVTITTPAYLPAAAQVGLTVEWTVVLANTGVYAVMGVIVNYSETVL